MRLFHRKNGVITILLVIILVPILTANSVLVEMIRYRSASQLTDMVAGNAILSALADFNTDLYKFYGLLAVDGDHADDVEKWVKANINADENSFSRVLDPSTLSVKTSGLYALNDVDVLKAQIMETEKLTGPYYVAEGVAEAVTGFDDLFKDLGKKLKKACGPFSLALDAGTTMDAAGDAANAGIDYSEKLKEWDEAKKAYDDKHTAYINTINGILKQYRKDYPDGQTDSDKLSGKKKDIEKAEKEYLAALDNLNKVGGELGDCAQAFVSKCTNTVKELTSTVANAKIEGDKKKLDEQKKKDKEAIDKDSSLSAEEKKAQKKEIDDDYELLGAEKTAVGNVPSNVAGYFKGFVDNGADFEANVFKSRLDANIKALKKTISEFDEYGYLLEEKERTKKDLFGNVVKDDDGNEVKETYYLAGSDLGADAYYKTVDYLTDNANSTFFEALREELTKELVGDANLNIRLVNVLKSAYALVDATISSVMFYDLHANGNIKSDFSLPSSTMTKSNFSYKTGDEELVDELLNSIKEAANYAGYDVSALYPTSRGTAAQLEQDIAARMQRVIDNIIWLMNELKNILSILQGNVLAFLKAVAGLKDVFQKIGQLADDVVYLAGHLGQVLMTATQTLYEGTMLNGYVLNHFTSRQDINAVNRTTFTSGYDGTYFKYAKAEYVLTGDRNEKTNQMNMSISLYIIRLLLNIFPVVTDKTVGEIAASAGPFCWLVYIAVVALETVLDVAALQGFQNRIPIYKTKLFFSAETLATIAVKFPGIAAGTKIQGNDKDIAVLTNMVKSMVDKIFDKQLFKFNYEDYLWLRLCFVPNDTKVKRIGDLIYMDMRQKDKNFSLGSQYTYLRVEINADHTSVMPLTDALDMAKISAIKYGGY